MYQYHKWLRSFHAVAKTGSFTLAAEYLSVGQPTVSEQVTALEKKFSVELFHRRGRIVEMSSAGHKLYAITQGLFGWTCPYKTGHQLPVKLMLPPSA